MSNELDNKVIDLYYEWFKSNHDYTDEQVMWSTNQDDIDDFVKFVKRALEDDFGIRSKA